jgi:hypothetical protein
MKKVTYLLSLVMLAATMSYAGTLNYYNHTSQTLRMLVNGNPACSGDVMPGGYCSTNVGAGTYLMQATNGRDTTGGYTCYLPTNDSGCDYTVNENTSELVSPDQKLIRVADLDYHNGFSVDVPLTMTPGDLVNRTTNQGHPFTQIIYTATMPNTDYYMVGVSTYGFSVEYADLDRMIEGFRGGIKGTVLGTPTENTVSGQPSKIAAFSSKDESTGREIRFVLLVTFKGNKAYMFAFGTYMDVKSTNQEEVKTFFTSARIQ